MVGVLWLKEMGISETMTHSVLTVTYLWPGQPGRQCSFSGYLTALLTVRE